MWANLIFLFFLLLPKEDLSVFFLFLCQRRLQERVFVVVYGLVRCELDCEESESVLFLRCARASRKESSLIYF